MLAIPLIYDCPTEFNVIENTTWTIHIKFKVSHSCSKRNCFIFVAVHCCPTFLYIYAHRLSVLPFPDWIKADHAFEVPLVLGEPYLERFPDVWSDSDKKVSKQCMQYWTNFAKTG